MHPTFFIHIIYTLVLLVCNELVLSLSFISYLVVNMHIVLCKIVLPYSRLGLCLST